MSERRLQYRIDLGQLKRNFAYLAQCAKNCRLMPVLKYDAYGMGAAAIGSALRDAGAYRFASADVNEALELKKLGLDVQILGILPDCEIPEAVNANIICPVCQEAAARMISNEAVRQNKKVRVAFKLDTGMGRIGFDPEADTGLIAELMKLPNLVADGIFSHFSTAGEAESEYAAFQIQRFKVALGRLEQAGCTFPHIHHAAGDAIVNIAASTMPPFNMARPGGIMYGSDFTSPCRQIVTLSTRIGALRTIPAGASVGYLRCYQAEKNTPVAVITAGYADGIPLALSNRGRVLVRGKSCPILGRVSMDYTVVDISNVPDAEIGDEVVLLGQQGEDAITIQEWAELKQTHSHDIWCAIGHRVQRVYLH